MDPPGDSDFFLQPCPASIVASSKGILREVMRGDQDQIPIRFAVNKSGANYRIKVAVRAFGFCVPFLKISAEYVYHPVQLEEGMAFEKGMRNENRGEPYIAIFLHTLREVYSHLVTIMISNPSTWLYNFILRDETHHAGTMGGADHRVLFPFNSKNPFDTDPVALEQRKDVGGLLVIT